MALSLRAIENSVSEVLPAYRRDPTRSTRFALIELMSFVARQLTRSKELHAGCGRFQAKELSISREFFASCA
jgi:hypothetical protein